MSFINFKRKKTIFFLIFCLTLFSGCQKFNELVFTIGSAVSTPQYAQTPVTRYSTPLPVFEPLQFAWFYKPPVIKEDLGAVAANFSMMVLTRNDEIEREEMRTLGSSSPVLQYLRFEAIMDAGDCSAKPFQNQAAHLEGDYCSIEERHPEWFLKDINSRNIQYPQSEYVIMDPGNADWQAYFLDKVKGFQQDEGWQGLFLDNVDASLGRFEEMHLLLGNYADDQSYQEAVKSFLKFIYADYFQPAGKSLYANIPYLQDNNVWFDYLEYLDGAMLEAFAADWNNGYLETQVWLDQMSLAEETQSLGKSIILVTQGNINDQQRIQFGLASYLLVNNGKAYYRYSNHEAYRELWWYPQFDLELGQPLGPRYTEDNQWRRDFEHGYVVVDPENHSAIIQTN